MNFFFKNKISEARVIIVITLAILLVFLMTSLHKKWQSYRLNEKLAKKLIRYSAFQGINEDTAILYVGIVGIPMDDFNIPPQNSLEAMLALKKAGLINFKKSKNIDNKNSKIIFYKISLTKNGKKYVVKTGSQEKKYYQNGLITKDKKNMEYVTVRVAYYHVLEVTNLVKRDVVATAEFSWHLTLSPFGEAWKKWKNKYKVNSLNTYVRHSDVFFNYFDGVWDFDCASGFVFD